MGSSPWLERLKRDREDETGMQLRVGSDGRNASDWLHPPSHVLPCKRP